MDPAIRARRTLILAVCFLFAFAVLFGRMLYIQVIRGPSLAWAALCQRSLGVAWGTPRGNFLDTQGRPLTGNSRVWRLVLFPSVPGVCESTLPFLESELRVPRKWLDGVVKRGGPSKVPAEITPDLRRRLVSLRLPGLILAEEPQRYGSPMAVHTIGYLNDGRGACGLEYIFEDELIGRAAGRLAAVVDAASRPIPGIGFRSQPPPPGEAGQDVVLTLNRDLQKIVEDSMDRAHIKGAVVAVDPANGDVLAIASRPSFDPAHLGKSLHSPDAPFLNRAVLAFYPGSVFKLIVAAAALEEGVVSPEDRFFDPGFIEVGGTRFRCHSSGGHHELSFADALAVSCNPVFIAVGQKLGAASIIATAERFGLGKPTGVGLREEAAGGLPTGWPLSLADVGNICIGQKGVFATPLQMCMAMAATANGGMLYRPRLVKEIRSAGGQVLRRFPIERVGRVMRPSTARKLHAMLSQAVSSGTARAALGIPGGAAGKTGTAETGRTTPNGVGINHAWFAGYTPLDNPDICIVVFAEDGDSGSQVATPLFVEIIQAYQAICE